MRELFQAQEISSSIYPHPSLLLNEPIFKSYLHPSTVVVGLSREELWAALQDQQARVGERPSLTNMNNGYHPEEGASKISLFYMKEMVFQTGGGGLGWCTHKVYKMAS